MLNHTKEEAIKLAIRGSKNFDSILKEVRRIFPKGTRAYRIGVALQVFHQQILKGCAEYWDDATFDLAQAIFRKNYDAGYYGSGHYCGKGGYCGYSEVPLADRHLSRDKLKRVKYITAWKNYLTFCELGGNRGRSRRATTNL